MDTFVAVLSVLGIGALISFLFSSKKKEKKESDTPPKNTAAGAARETVQQTFEEEISGIHKAVKGDDPAGDLADQGNARSRR